MVGHPSPQKALTSQSWSYSIGPRVRWRHGPFSFIQRKINNSDFIRHVSMFMYRGPRPRPRPGPGISRYGKLTKGRKQAEDVCGKGSVEIHTWRAHRLFWSVKGNWGNSGILNFNPQSWLPELLPRQIEKFHHVAFSSVSLSLCARVYKST